MRMVLENGRRVSLLKSDLQGVMEISQRALTRKRSGRDDLESMEVKCKLPSFCSLQHVAGIWGRHSLLYSRSFLAEVNTGYPLLL